MPELIAACCLRCRSVYLVAQLFGIAIGCPGCAINMPFDDDPYPTMFALPAGFDVKV